MLSVATTRKIDRWVGVPLCRALSLWNNIFRRKAGSQPPKNILVLQLSEMGSLALALPAVRELKARLPEARVRFLVFTRNRQFAELVNVAADEDLWTLDDSGLWAFARSCWRFMLRARRERIDATLDFELFARVTAILARLSGARRRAGFHNYRAEGLHRGSLLTHPVTYNVYKHIAENFIAQARALTADAAEQPALKETIETDLSLPRLPVASEAAEKMRARVRELYPDLSEKTRIVALSPYSGNLLPIRAWPVEHYAALVEGLLERTADTIAVAIGLPEAAEHCHKLFERVKSPRLVNFIGQTKNIREVVELLSVSRLFVTTDSGPAHFAALTDTPTIAMFGPECPQRYGPLGENIKTVFLGLQCSPCVSAFNHRDTPCQNNVCMQEIQPARMLELALELLNLRTGDGLMPRQKNLRNL